MEVKRRTKLADFACLQHHNPICLSCNANSMRLLAPPCFLDDDGTPNCRQAAPISGPLPKSGAGRKATSSLYMSMMPKMAQFPFQESSYLPSIKLEMVGDGIDLQHQPGVDGSARFREGPENVFQAQGGGQSFGDVCDDADTPVAAFQEIAGPGRIRPIHHPE